MKRSYSVLFLVVCCVLSVGSVQFALAQDGQLTWTQNLSNGGRVYAMAINPVSPAIIYSAGLDSGVYKTTNAGVSWSAVNTGLTYRNVQALAISPSNPNVLYAGTDHLGGANKGVYVTTNAGASWTLTGSALADSGIQALAVDPSDPNVAYAAVFDGVVPNPINGLYKTTNAGATWFADTAGLGLNRRFLCVAVNPFNRNTVYAGTSFMTAPATPSKAYKSVNGGNTWTEITNGMPQLTTNVNPIRAFSISTLDTNVVLAALFVNDTAGGAFLTTNGGALWTKKHNGLPAVAGTLLRACLIRPGSSSEFFVGLDGGGATSRGVWRTVNGGNNWVDFNSGTMSNTHTVRALVAKTQVESTLYVGNATASPATVRGVHEYSWPTHDIGTSSLTRLTSLATIPNVVSGDVGDNQTAEQSNAVADVVPLNAAQQVSVLGDAAVLPAAFDQRPLSLDLALLADTARFRAIVRNYGSIPESTYQVRWSADGVVQATLNNARPLTVAGLDTFLFQWNNVPIGSHTVRAWTLLGSDANRSNDTASTSFTISPPVTVLYDNGPLSTGPVTKSGVVAPPGATWSEVQNPANDTTQSNTTAGFSGGITTTTRFRLADNFTVPAGQQWTIDSISTFAYQTGSTPGTSPFIAINAQIWNGRPGDAGSAVVAGDTTTNRLRSTIWATYYRVFNSRYPPPGSVPGTTRPVFRNNANMGGITLGPGTYWLDWQTQITASGAHFAPPVTVVGRRGNAAWNGRQWIGTLWQDANDTGNPAAAPDSVQDFPFVIMGSSTPLITPGWTTRTSGTTSFLQSVKQVNASVIWAAGNAATVRRSTDGGSTWTNGNPNPGVITGDIYNIEALDANTAFVTTSPAATFIYRTTNGGTLWTQVFTQTGGFINAIRMSSATNGIATGDPVSGLFTILRTTDGGGTWNRIATEPTPSPSTETGLNNSLSTVGTTHIWFGSSVGPVWRSTNAGATWTRVATTFTGNNLEVHFNNTLNGVTGNSGGLANRSTDGGATWVATTIPGAGGVNGLSGAGFEFFATKGTNVYRSTDKGATWTVSYTGAIGTLTHLDFFATGTTSSAFFYGTAVSQTGGIATAYLNLVTAVEEPTGELPKVFSLAQNYPNPFNPTTTLSYALPKDARVTLSIYNILGQRVATLKDEVQSVGYYDVVWNGSNDFGSQISSGVYFYRIEAKPVDGGEPFTSLKKMLMLK